MTDGPQRPGIADARIGLGLLAFYLLDMLLGRLSDEYVPSVNAAVQKQVPLAFIDWAAALTGLALTADWTGARAPARHAARMVAGVVAVGLIPASVPEVVAAYAGIHWTTMRAAFNTLFNLLTSAMALLVLLRILAVTRIAGGAFEAALGRFAAVALVVSSCALAALRLTSEGFLSASWGYAVRPTADAAFLSCAGFAVVLSFARLRNLPIHADDVRLGWISAGRGAVLVRRALFVAALSAICLLVYPVTRSLDFRIWRLGSIAAVAGAVMAVAFVLFYEGVLAMARGPLKRDERVAGALVATVVVAIGLSTIRLHSWWLTSLPKSPYDPIPFPIRDWGELNYGSFCMVLGMLLMSRSLARHANTQALALAFSRDAAAWGAAGGLAFAWGVTFKVLFPFDAIVLFAMVSTLLVIPATRALAKLAQVAAEAARTSVPVVDRDAAVPDGPGLSARELPSESNKPGP